MKLSDRWQISITIPALLILGACSENISWHEEVRLLSGELVSVRRSVDIGLDEWARFGRGPIKSQALRFTNQGEQIVWSLDRTGFFDDIPITFDWVEGAPTVVLPLHDWRSCRQYGFPATGLAAMSYRNRRWELLPSERLPMTLKVNLLQLVRAVRSHKGGAISESWKDREDRSSSVRQGMQLDDVSRKLNEAEDSCASMNPGVDRAQNQRIDSFAAAETRALTLVSEVVSVSTVTEEVSGEAFERANGKWFAPGYLSPSCHGIVNTMKPWYRWQFDERGAGKSLVGALFVILDETAQSSEIEFPDNQGSLQSVVCDQNSVVTIKRISKSQLILHRFARNGQVKGVFRVGLPGSDSFAADGAWGMVWKPSWDSTAGLSFSIVDYRYPQLANWGGTISHRADFVVRLPDAPH